MTKMYKPIFLICFGATVSSANFFNLIQTAKTAEVSNICIFSQNPNRFPPQCCLCKNAIYPTVLQTCVNGTLVMPKNVSYDQASCIVANCGINFPTAPPQMANPFEEFIKSTILNMFKIKTKRSVQYDVDNRVESAGPPLMQMIPEDLYGVEVNIVRQIETYASDLDESENLEEW